MGHLTNKTSIIFLDDNKDLRDVIQSIIESHIDIQCACFGAVQEIKNDQDLVLSSQVAILDIELGYQQPSGVDAYKWLVESGFKGSIVFLTGHGYSNPLVQAATRLGAVIWEKPIGSAQIIADLKVLLSKKTLNMSETAI